MSENPKAVEAAKVRAALKHAAKKEGGFALYLIPENGQPFYRLGVLHPPGSVVRLPLAEEPSVTWEAVEEPKPEPVEDAKPAPAPGPSKGAPVPAKAARPSDRDI